MLRVVLVLVLVLAPLAAARSPGHEGEARPIVLRDAAPDGHAVVGEVTHFGYALLNAAGYPQVHEDATYTLAQNGKVLFSSASAHEYDGLFSHDVVFTEPGPYEVVVEWMDRQARFNGTVVEPASVVEGARLDVVAPDVAVAGEAVDVDLAILDAAGAIVPHSDVIVESWRGTQLTLRTRLHTHEDRMAFSYAFPAAGDYVLRFTSYIAFPSPDAPDLRAFVTEHAVSVDAAPPALPVPSAAADCAADPVLAAPTVPAADPGHDGGPTFNVSIDPQAVLGPATPARLNALVLGASEEPHEGHEGDMATERGALQHVNFEASVVGPSGVVFRSASLHEYDGHYELVVRPEALGSYGFSASTSSKSRDLDASASQGFCVVPPLFPVGAGAADVALEGADALVAGEASDLVVTFLDAAGRPVPHSEVDLSVVRVADGLVVSNTKLHGHAGKMVASVAFPTAGDHVVRVVPMPLSPSLALVDGVEFPVSVAPGAADPAAVTDVGVGTQPVPAAGLAAMALVALAAIAWRRR